MYSCVLLLLLTGALACTENEKQCLSNNKCLPAKWWCDGQEDCQDGSDESNCDPCNSNPCKNNGTCYGTKFGFRCDCVATFAGTVCEKPICDQNEPPQRRSENNGGAVYVRWGRTNCTSHARLVYKGYAGGSHYTHTGGGSNYICLPDQPTWSKYSNTATGYFGYVWGAEYEMKPLQSSLLSTTNSGGVSLGNNDVPCAVCQSMGRTSVLMIPGKKECYSRWVQEYTGMLMSAYYGHKGRTEFVCMDADPEIRPSGHANNNGVLFYFVQGKCGSLPCPPYVANRELSCVVCTN